MSWPPVKCPSHSHSTPGRPAEKPPPPLPLPPPPPPPSPVYLGTILILLQLSIIAGVDASLAIIQQSLVQLVRREPCTQPRHSCVWRFQLVGCTCDCCMSHLGMSHLSMSKCNNLELKECTGGAIYSKCLAVFGTLWFRYLVIQLQMLKNQRTTVRICESQHAIAVACATSRMHKYQVLHVH